MKFKYVSPGIVITLKSHLPGIGVSLIELIDKGRSQLPKPLPNG